jgi:trehalose/maltose hydrolase-like predicted phosphorylase
MENLNLTRLENQEGWTLEATTRDHYNPPTLANGRIGIVPSTVPFAFERVLLNNVYDKENSRGVSRIVEGIDFLHSELTINGERVTGANISDWKQILNLGEASLTTSFTFRNLAQVTYRVQALRQMPYTALMNVEIHAEQPLKLAFANSMRLPEGLLEPTSHFETLHDVETSMPLYQVSAQTRYLKIAVTATTTFLFDGAQPELHSTGIQRVEAVGFETDVQAGKDFAFGLAGAITSSADFYDPKTESERFCISMLLQKSATLLNAHRAAWSEIWKNDIAIEGDLASQLAVRFSLFNLYSFSRTGSRLSIPPMGLSSTGYNGHVFWDMELWMMPPLLVMNPELARAALDYRFDRLGKARQKAENFGYKGAMFPWESDASGEEATPAWALTGTFEQHITADIGIAAWNYYRVTGDTAWLRDTGYPLLKEIAAFWVSRVTPNSDGSYSILNVVGADEFAQNIDDNAFTNGSAIKVLHDAVEAAKTLKLHPDPQWLHVADHIRIAHLPDGVTREHASYQGERIKQADANLLIYPLGLITDATQIKRDLSYYEPKMAEEGPAMGHSVMSVIYSRLGDSASAFRLFQQAYLPNSRPPFGVLSESATSNNPYFATGAGGMLQAVLFGFAGLEVTDHGLVKQKPCLPKHWKSLTITGLGLKGGALHIVQP